MFQEYTSSGKHMICDFKDIKNSELLNNMEELNLVMREICKTNEFTILNEIEHQFSPIGCSFLFLLSESHLSIHTFPEKKHISFDIYTCRQYENNDIYNEIFYTLIDKLQASLDSNCRIMERYF